MGDVVRFETADQRAERRCQERGELFFRKLEEHGFVVDREAQTLRAPEGMGGFAITELADRLWLEANREVS